MIKAVVVIMADVGDNNFMRYVYRGEEGEIIPWGATHITIDKSCTIVRAEAFHRHRNIIEVIFHDEVRKIERAAFSYCPELLRVFMPGVKIDDEEACGELEIEHGAFRDCESLRSINLPSARIVEEYAFSRCYSLTDVKFGNKLERFEVAAFFHCASLERITIPLKDGIITADDIFQVCENLRHVDLVEGEIHETIAALQLEEWRNDMNQEIDSISRILPTTYSGYHDDFVGEDYGQKARVIRRWIRRVLVKIIDYKAQHQRLLDEAATTLQLNLPRDILMNNILPFLELPSHTFEVEDMEEDE